MSSHGAVLVADGQTLARSTLAVGEYVVFRDNPLADRSHRSQIGRKSQLTPASFAPRMLVFLTFTRRQEGTLRSTLRRRLSVLAFVVVATTAATFAQQVTRVIDGDTIVVEGLRLIGVDTPEPVDPRRPVRYFGAEASAFTTKLAQGKTVRLQFEGAMTDKYNRALAYVYLPDGVLLNAEINRRGYGHAYTQFPFGRMDKFRQLQREAAEGDRGLWAGHASGDVAAVSALSGEPQTAPGTETVYATRTGAKYHRAGCRHLARSQILMSLKEAAARYGPCSVCRPPILAATPALETAAVVPTSATPASGESAEAATPVMVTRTGMKYHRAECRTLRNGGIASTLGRASKRYRPCAVCRPSVLAAVAIPATPATVAPSPPSVPAVASGQCQGITKKGTQCSRTAQAGRNYCWQH